VLKRWKGGSLAWILALACFSLKSLKGITQEWREGSERALFWLWKEFSSKERQERENWRRGGSIYTPWPKNSRWANSYPETPGICPETPGNPNFSAREQHPDTPGKGVRSIRPCTREYPGLGRMKTHVLLFWVYFVALRCLSRFSWAQDLNRNPWIKSLLIVRCPYTQISNIKSNSLSMLELRLFISFLRGRTSSFVSPIQTHHLHTCSITRLNIHVFCHYSPKPT